MKAISTLKKKQKNKKAKIIAMVEAYCKYSKVIEFTGSKVKVP